MTRLARGAGILGGMQNPANIQAWHRAIALAVRVHRISRGIKRTQAPGLRTQVDRAVDSIPSNIAEGVAQPSAADCARFLSYAVSSAFEVESHLILADKLGLNLVGIEEALDEIRQIRRMTFSLRKYYVEKAKREKQKGRDS